MKLNEVMFENAIYFTNKIESLKSIVQLAMKNDDETSDNYTMFNDAIELTNILDDLILSTPFALYTKHYMS